MASYTEIRDLFVNSELRNRVEVAVIVAAHGLLTGTPTSSEAAWASDALEDPRREAAKAWSFVLAANKAASTAQITGATDTAIQANVDSVVPSLVVARGL